MNFLFLELGDRAVGFCIFDLGRKTQEMPSRLRSELMLSEVPSYDVRFEDGTSIEIWVDPALVTQVVGERDAVAKRLSLLPSFMGETLKHVAINSGDSVAFSEHLGHFIVLYADNMKMRRQNNNMEESIFHETVHATMDHMYRDNDPNWKFAQNVDRAFVTEYAENNPSEDLAETAIFAFVEKYHPGRLPSHIAEKISQLTPNRMEYLNKIFPDENEYFYQVSAKGLQLGVEISRRSWVEKSRLLSHF